MIKYFLLGVWEFRLSFTTRPPDAYRESYDWGREWAHRLTLRTFEENDDGDDT
jgi:hypothetical protein